MKNIIDLTKAKGAEDIRGKSKIYELLWMICEAIFVTNPIQFSSRLRILFIELFGGKIGKNVIYRPRTRIKYPWKLVIGDNCWIGEGVWFHNQGQLNIGDNVVISQETFITTGSHDTTRSMDLIIKDVTIDSGVWITSRCIVLSGVYIGKNAIVTPGSVVRKNIESNKVYGGNPLQYIKDREIQ